MKIHIKFDYVVEMNYLNATMYRIRMRLNLCYIIIKNTTKIIVLYFTWCPFDKHSCAKSQLGTQYMSLHKGLMLNNNKLVSQLGRHGSGQYIGRQ